MAPLREAEARAAPEGGAAVALGRAGAALEGAVVAARAQGGEEEVVEVVYLWGYGGGGGSFTSLHFVFFAIYPGGFEW